MTLRNIHVSELNSNEARRLAAIPGAVLIVAHTLTSAARAVVEASNGKLRVITPRAYTLLCAMDAA